MRTSEKLRTDGLIILNKKIDYLLSYIYSNSFCDEEGTRKEVQSVVDSIIQNEHRTEKLRKYSSVSFRELVRLENNVFGKLARLIDLKDDYNDLTKDPKLILQKILELD